MTKYQCKGLAWKGSPIELKEIIREKAEKYKVDAQLMSAISYCESSYNTKATNSKNNIVGVDGGVAQLNSFYHDKELKKQKLDKFNPIDAYDYMAQLLKKNGTSDYKSSRACWEMALSTLKT